MRYHILSNVLGPILVYATSLISVSHHPGRGPELPRPRRQAARAEWGLMLNTLRQAIYVNPVAAPCPAS